MASRAANQTADKLLQAAHDLLVERSGQSASVSEICARAEVNVAMVKYCFGSKDGLLDAVLERALRQLAGELERLADADLTPEVKLRRHVAEVVRNYVRVPYVNRLMNERLLAAEPDAVDRISASFAIPARDWYAELLAAGQAEERWRQLRPDAVLLRRDRAVRVPVLGAAAARARLRRVDRRRTGRAVQRRDRRAGDRRRARPRRCGDCRNGQLRP